MASEVDLRNQESNQRGITGVSVSEAPDTVPLPGTSGTQAHMSSAFTNTPVSEGTFCMFMLEIYCINTLKLIYVYVAFFNLWSSFFKDHLNICIYILQCILFSEQGSD